MTSQSANQKTGRKRVLTPAQKKETRKAKAIGKLYREVKGLDLEQMTISQLSSLKKLTTEAGSKRRARIQATMDAKRAKQRVTTTLKGSRGKQWMTFSDEETNRNAHNLSGTSGWNGRPSKFVTLSLDMPSKSHQKGFNTYELSSGWIVSSLPRHCWSPALIYCVMGVEIKGGNSRTQAELQYFKNGSDQMVQIRASKPVWESKGFPRNLFLRHSGQRATAKVVVRVHVGYLVNRFGLPLPKADHPPAFSIAPLLRYYKFAWENRRRAFTLNIPDHAICLYLPAKTKVSVSIDPKNLTSRLSDQVTSCEMTDPAGGDSDGERKEDEETQSSEETETTTVDTALFMGSEDRWQRLRRYSTASARAKVSSVQRGTSADPLLGITFWGHDDGPIGVIQFDLTSVDDKAAVFSQFVSGAAAEIRVLARMN